MIDVESKSEIDHQGLPGKKVRIEVSEDNYEAYIIVESAEVELSVLQETLKSNNIVYGIDSNAFAEAQQNPGQRKLIASGSRHVDGKDGRFERIQNRAETEAEKKFGISNIYAGEAIGVIFKSDQGTAGVDVFGRKIQPKQGKQINIFTGPNIKRTDAENQTTLEALIDGNLKIGTASIEISTEHVIRGDIDYSDGEIEFAGSLRILGDVKGSSNLKVRHDAFIQGSVEDAKIISGGNVTIKGSFVGRGDGLIKAKGNVEAHVILNQMIEAGGSITITKESVNAHLVAADAVYAPLAVIMGGAVTAGNKIEVRTLGGELYSTTKARLGKIEVASDDSAVIDKEIELQNKILDQMKNEVYLLVRERMDGNNFTADKSEKLKFTQAKLQELNETVKSLTAKKQEVKAESSHKKSPKLVVLGTIHQSVLLEINGIRTGLKQSCNNVTIEESNNEIIRTKNL